MCILTCCVLCGSAGAGGSPSVPAAASPEGVKRIAVLPVENLSGAPVPLKELNAELNAVLKRAGVPMIERTSVESFVESHRVRYLGGIDEIIAAAVSAETGADAVLISTVELYSEVSPPKFSLISRMVSLKGTPEIIWMDSVGISGDDAPGILGLGLIDDLKVLRGRAIELIGTSLKRYFSDPPLRKQRVSARAKREEEPFILKNMMDDMKTEKRTLTDPSSSRTRAQDTGGEPDRAFRDEGLSPGGKSDGGRLSTRYNPLDWYSSKEELVEQERTIAIIPFFNRSTRKHAAELLALHLAAQLVAEGSFRILEFGVIRDKLLSMHVIMSDGIAIPGLDLVGISLGVDLLLNGVVFDYLDTVGFGTYPGIDFSLQMFDRDNKNILWSSHSHNQGNDGVFLFDYGRVATAGALADKMCRALVLKLVDNADEY